jgi:hypothetical protein
MGVRVPETRVTIGLYDLAGERGTEQDIADLVKGLNRMSALITLARINILLAVDRFRRDNELTIKVQGYLVSNFLDDDIFSRLKEKFGPERLDVRSIFHSQRPNGRPLASYHAGGAPTLIGKATVVLQNRADSCHFSRAFRE